MNKRCRNNAYVHPLVGVKPNVMAAGEIDLWKSKCEHQRARDVPAAA
jgi:hypothetical protein